MRPPCRLSLGTRHPMHTFGLAGTTLHSTVSLLSDQQASTLTAEWSHGESRGLLAGLRGRGSFSLPPPPPPRGTPAEGAKVGTWAPVEALGQSRRVSVYQPHDLHMSILLGQHPGRGSTVVSRVHSDSLGKFMKEQALGTSPVKHHSFPGCRHWTAARERTGFSPPWKGLALAPQQPHIYMRKRRHLKDKVGAPGEGLAGSSVATRESWQLLSLILGLSQPDGQVLKGEPGTCPRWGRTHSHGEGRLQVLEPEPDLHPSNVGMSNSLHFSPHRENCRQQLH